MARVLIIDNEELALYTMRKFLQPFGHSVTEAKNGAEGIELQNRSPFDLIITDILMPEKEGIETIVELKKSYPDQKIIAISGGGKDGYQGYLDSARALGANETVAKPFTQDELITAVDGCLSGP